MKYYIEITFIVGEGEFNQITFSERAEFEEAKSRQRDLLKSAYNAMLNNKTFCVENALFKGETLTYFSCNIKEAT